MDLEGRLEVNEASVGISDDNDQPLFKVENEELLHGNTPWDLSALPTECRGSTSSDTVLRNGVCDYQREGNLLCRPSKPGTVKHYIEQIGKSGKHYTPYIKYTKLDFKVDTFFAVGSPLGVFLALRNVRIGTGNGQEYWQDEGITEEMPACRQMLNIFHPYDPVAYRLEPLVCKEHVDKRPIFIPYHKGGKRLHIGMQEFSEDLSARSKAFMNRLKSVRARMVGVFGSSVTGKDDDSEDGAKKDPIKTYGAMVMDRLTGSPDGRLDYVLQDATFEHQYISAISSHTAYWRDLDTALFILKHLYREIPPEPPEANKHNVSERRDCKDQGSSVDQTWRVDSLDEEVAFTFSSKESISALSSLRRSLKGIAKA